MTFNHVVEGSIPSRLTSRSTGILAAALLGVALAACRTSAPATLTLGQHTVLKGSATTTINGQFNLSDGHTTCYGSYTGLSIDGVSLPRDRDDKPVKVSCSDGRHGSSNDQLFETGRATVIFSDGRRGVLRLGG